jgi:hypothetical protein
MWANGIFTMARSWVCARVRDNNVVIVVVRGWSEKEYENEFQGVESVKAAAPEHIQSYAI